MNADLRAALDDIDTIRQETHKSWVVSSLIRSAFSNDENAYWETVQDFMMLAVAQQHFQIAQTLEPAEIARLNVVVSRILGEEFRYGEEPSVTSAQQSTQQQSVRSQSAGSRKEQSQQEPKSRVKQESVKTEPKEKTQPQQSATKVTQKKKTTEKQSVLKKQIKKELVQQTKQQSASQPDEQPMSLGVFASALSVTSDSPYDIYPPDKSFRRVIGVDKALSDAAMNKAIAQLEARGYTDTKKLSFGVLITMLCLNFVDDGSFAGVVLSDDDKALLNIIADSKPVNFDVLMDKLDQLEHAVDSKNKNISTMRSEMDTLSQIAHTTAYLLTSLVSERFAFRFIDKDVDVDTFDPTRDVIVRFVDTINTRVGRMLSSKKQRAGRMR